MPLPSLLIHRLLTFRRKHHWLRCTHGKPISHSACSAYRGKYSTSLRNTEGEAYPRYRH